MSLQNNTIEEFSTDIDLDRDMPVGDIEHDGTYVNVDWKKQVEFEINDRSFDTVSDMLNEMSEEELECWIDDNVNVQEWK